MRTIDATVLIVIYKTCMSCFVSLSVADADSVCMPACSNLCFVDDPSGLGEVGYQGQTAAEVLTGLCAACET